MRATMILVLCMALARPAMALVVAAEDRAEKTVESSHNTTIWGWWWEEAACGAVLLFYGKRIFARSARKRG